MKHWHVPAGYPIPEKEIGDGSIDVVICESEAEEVQLRILINGGREVSAIDIIDERVQELINDANEFAIANPLGYQRTHVDTMVGAQIRVLKEIKSSIMLAEANAIEKAIR